MSRVDRSRLPGTGPARPFTLPEAVRETLPNGLLLRVAQFGSVPVAAAVLVVPTGVSADPADRRGRAAFLADMLDEGTGTLDAPGFSAAVADIGGDLEIEAGSEATLVGITSLSRQLPRALQLIADATLRPALRDGDIERVRALRLERLRQLQDQPGALAERAFGRAVFGGHPYGNPSLGSAAALRALTADDVRRTHRARFVPQGASLVVVSDRPLDEVRRACLGAFGDWAASDAASDTAAPVVAPTVAGIPHTALVPRPGAAQSELRIGHASDLSRHAPEYHAALLLNAVLGGQFVSRLNLNLRERRGLTYGVRSGFDLRSQGGAFTVQTSVHTAGTAVAVAEVARELAAVVDGAPVTPEELTLARASLTLGYPRSFETAQQVARSLAQLAIYGLPDDHYARFVPAVEAVDHADLQAAAQRYLQPSALTTVVVGSADDVRAALDGGTPSMVDAASLLA